MSNTPSPASNPSVTGLLLRRLAAFLYDALVVIGLLMVATFPYLGVLHVVSGADAATAGDPFFRIYVGFIVFGYVWISWRRSGQTIGMKAWRIQAVADGGGPLSHTQIALRFGLGIPALLLAGLGYLWVYWSVSGRTLPEQYSHTQTQYLAKPTS